MYKIDYSSAKFISIEGTISSSLINLSNVCFLSQKSNQLIFFMNSGSEHICDFKSEASAIVTYNQIKEICRC